MKFNWETLRCVLLFIEENMKQQCADPADYRTITIKGFSREEVDYHVKFASEARLISVNFGLEANEGDIWTSYSVRRIHASGHSFIENTRSQEAVQFVRDGVVKINNGSLDAVCQLSKAYLKQQVAKMSELQG
ncbi:DUF2513 domain-containing protein [Agrobacterium vitis]